MRQYLLLTIYFKPTLVFWCTKPALDGVYCNFTCHWANKHTKMLCVIALYKFEHMLLESLVCIY